MREIHYTEQFQYGQLREALSALNFQEQNGQNDFGAPIRVFYNREHDALITLPDKPDVTTLEPIYLRIAEKTVEDWSIADSETFFKLLRKMTPIHAQIA